MAMGRPRRGGIQFKAAVRDIGTIAIELVLRTGAVEWGG
jgi:hypothetical protein